MARPKLPDEVKRLRGTLRNRSDGTCEWAQKMHAKPVPAEWRGLYDEAIDRIDSGIGHYDGYHDVDPASVDLDDIEAVEKALASVGIEVNVSGFYRLAERQLARNGL
jgi:hypothetical protein